MQATIGIVGNGFVGNAVAKGFQDKVSEVRIYDIDESKFEIDKKDSINVSPVDYLMYKHNLPKSMQIRIWLKNSDNPYIMEQMNLFVVNYKYFQTFIKLLTKKFKTHTI